MEYLSGYHASPTDGLYGQTGLISPGMPRLNEPVMNRIGCHIREGEHDITP
ncbi:MAG TPA: hypothetical protein PLD74_02315 [Prolixibacteraceae bacterium]|nr:hypothetical protein [Prolixibacteraceae bacterium]HOS00890.1 hypothetical protein [Prolixibacteraceae bacterium]HPL46008.1 hypothetical protein [Prolixibacteraceae bacterium]HPN77561.1 hypothetical protein [Prolixibacteraceae bacterium]HPV19686.1 hypothetical protein [Prolixibacteraceae bacterium]